MLDAPLCARAARASASTRAARDARGVPHTHIQPPRAFIPFRRACASPRQRRHVSSARCRSIP